jgi:hypothetical protein
MIPNGFINRFIEEFSLKRSKPSFSKKNLYLSMKAGPDGPATLTSYYSLLKYSYEEMQGIFNITDAEGVDFFCKSYKYAWENDLYPGAGTGLCNACASRSNGKLSFVKDPEAKLRIIAISDYYTQIFLKPIHNIVLNILKRSKLNNFDRTFTQTPTHKWCDNGSNF